MQIDLQEDEGVEVQMAPLIDAVFLLLIFFLVATTLRKIEPEVPIEPPMATFAQGQPVDDTMIIIPIDETGQFYLEGNPVGQGYLWQKLKEAAAANPDRRIRIDADKDTPAQALVQVLEMAKHEGLENVGIKAIYAQPEFQPRVD
jgi:biopolymer transport protein ExbD